MIEMSRRGPDEQQQQLNYRELITDAGCFVTASLVYRVEVEPRSGSLCSPVWCG